MRPTPLPFATALDLIYLRGYKRAQVEPYLEGLAFNSAANYPLVMTRMKEVCRMHHHLLNHSMEVIHQGREEESGLLEKLVAIQILYYHFESVSLANKQMCELWNSSLKRPFFQLKQEAMDLAAIRELVPNSRHVNISHLQDVLMELETSPEVRDAQRIERQHIERLKRVFRWSPLEKYEEVVAFLTRLKIEGERLACRVEERSVERWRGVGKKN